MQQLSDEGRRVVEGAAQRHGFSVDAVTQMLSAVASGYGNQAQFNHFEFGGMGQWSSGGMIMIGDMFNNNLKARVASLCQDLANAVQGQQLFQMPAQSQSQSQGSNWQSSPPMQQQQQGGYGGGSSLYVGGGSSNWWPGDLGSPGSSGSQNNLRYAYFPNTRRLAIDVGGQVTVYDTGDHQIGGFGQQQSGDQSLTFTSQFGVVRVADLPIVSGGNQSAQASQAVQQAPSYGNPAPTQSAAMPAPHSGGGSSPRMTPDEVFATIEKLADLKSKGILTDAEFETKKADLLGRL